MRTMDKLVMGKGKVRKVKVAQGLDLDRKFLLARGREIHRGLVHTTIQWGKIQKTRKFRAPRERCRVLEKN